MYGHERGMDMYRSEFTNVIDLTDYGTDWWLRVVKLGSDIYEHPERYKRACEGKART